MPSLYEAIGYQVVGAINQIEPPSNLRSFQESQRQITGQYFTQDYFSHLNELNRFESILRPEDQKRKNQYSSNVAQILYSAALNPSKN